ncbi:Clavaminate synthase-like protein [Gymnopilus junonius]|uniref:Clavaminate synthase-like protein n=1 Tax=Gymnopilus junonius TaxID=109634 RepID=A0A9P5TN72_GYMJU|nr:Clavaminate synthase-like protein [Gymnopilus junonius]
MAATSLPPFPTDLPVQDLLVVDFRLLKAGDKEQADILWRAATTWGFWYLKNHNVNDFVESMFEMGKEVMALPFKEKMKYWQGNKGGSFGYRHAGATYTDVDGSTDVAEFINISKDDALTYPDVIHKVYPAPVNSHMKEVVRPFIQACLKSSAVLMDVFNEKLQLPIGTLSELHRPEKECISEARCIRVPPALKDTKVALGAHTDFGSISILANKLGGLQVLVSAGNTSEWKYVKPIDGFVICNIGDTLSILSGGVLKSCVHRVVPPPGLQFMHERWSLVYFSRPINDVYLEALSEKSLVIAETVKNTDKRMHEPGMTAAQWFTKRQKQYRTDSEKDIENILAPGPKDTQEQN